MVQFFLILWTDEKGRTRPWFGPDGHPIEFPTADDAVEHLPTARRIPGCRRARIVPIRSLDLDSPPPASQPGCR